MVGSNAKGGRHLVPFPRVRGKTSASQSLHGRGRCGIEEVNTSEAWALLDSGTRPCGLRLGDGLEESAGDISRWQPGTVDDDLPGDGIAPTS